MTDQIDINTKHLRQLTALGHVASKDRHRLILNHLRLRVVDGDLLVDATDSYVAARRRFSDTVTHTLDTKADGILIPAYELVDLNRFVQARHRQYGEAPESRMVITFEDRIATVRVEYNAKRGDTVTFGITDHTFPAMEQFFGDPEAGKNAPFAFAPELFNKIVKASNRRPNPHWVKITMVDPLQPIHLHIQGEPDFHGVMMPVRP